MTTQISNNKQIDNWIEEMIYVEEHLYKISLPYHKYSISCYLALGKYPIMKHLNVLLLIMILVALIVKTEE
jgi:hypothetical protein